MATQYTPNFQIPYPDGSELARNGPAQLQAIAARLDSILSGAFVPYRTAAGKTSALVVGANAGAQVAVTFPVGRFTVAPIVTAAAESNGYGTASVEIASKDSMTVRYYNPTGSAPTSPRINWTATQMLPSAAAG